MHSSSLVGLSALKLATTLLLYLRAMYMLACTVDDGDDEDHAALNPRPFSAVR